MSAGKHVRLRRVRRIVRIGVLVKVPVVEIWRQVLRLQSVSAARQWTRSTPILVCRCVESERQYDGSRFNNNVCSDYSFEDHNPPTIQMILDFCQHAEAQLKNMPDRTIVIHCKAGKVGRKQRSALERLPQVSLVDIIEHARKIIGLRKARGR